MLLYPGNQGPDWNRGEFGIAANTGVVDIVFTAMVGNSFRSDTALDDIVLRKGKCTSDSGENPGLLSVEWLPLVFLSVSLVLV